MNENKYTTESKSSTLGTILKTAGILGLGYLAYKKRDTLQTGFVAVKDKTVDVGSKITNNVKQGANHFQDYIQNKTQDANSAISSLGQQIEDKYHSLQGDAQDAYVKSLNTLNDKISNIKSSTKSTVNDVKSAASDVKGSITSAANNIGKEVKTATNEVKSTVGDAVKSASDKIDDVKPNIIHDANHSNGSPHNDLNHLKPTQH